MITWTNTLIGSGSGSGAGSGSSGSGSVTDSILNIADLELDLTTNDIKLPPRIIRGAEAVAQRVRVRFRFFLGEWYLDTRLGVPYYRDILVLNPDKILITFIFRQVLLTTPGVKSVASFRASLDSAIRELTVDFEVVLVDGTILTAAAEPFIIG